MGMGCLLDSEALEVMKWAAGLLFIDITPEVLAEGKGSDLRKFPQDTHPGTVLPALPPPPEAQQLGQDGEWRPHWHPQPHWLPSVQHRPQAARLLSGSLQTLQRKQRAKVCAGDSKVTRHEPTRPSAPCQHSAWNHSEPDSRP